MNSSQFSLKQVLLPVILVFLIIALLFMAIPKAFNQPERNLIDPNLRGEAAVNAVKALRPEDRKSLSMRERQRLTAEPFDVSALDNLALLEDLDNHAEAAQSIALEASDRSLRNIQSQFRALRLYLLKKDYAKASYHLDGILVSDPQMAPSLYPSISALFNDDAAVELLAKTMNRNPPWRSSLVNALVENDNTSQLAFKLFSQLRRTGGAPDKYELLSYLKKLTSSNQYERAYFVWLDSLDETALRKVGNVFDGGFDLEPKNQIFDWSVYPFSKADIGVIQRRDNLKNRVLRLSFYNTTEQFGNVSQMTRLRPGQYVFSGSHLANAFKVAGGLKVQIICVEAGSALGESKPFVDSSPWQSFSFEFKVPDEKCAVQLLRIISASPAILDAKLDGEILFDDFSILEKLQNDNQQKTP
jgi:hypothetical protein